VFLSLSCSFARAETRRLEVAGTQIDLDYAPDDFGDGGVAVVDWVETSARAVASFYGRFPVERVRVRLRTHWGSGVDSGRTVSWGPTISVSLGRSTDREQQHADWVMTHEMVHLAFPSVASQHHWLEEGLATYVEPLARLEIGEIPPEKVWLDLVEGLPHGLPGSGDRGLDFTPTWGRTYWGGALFCLLADIEIHKRTDNRMGLRDALRGILEAGGDMTKSWEIEAALAAGDKAVGVPVLSELYARMRADPSPVDLEEIWKSLGVEMSGGRVRLVDAPLAKIRGAIAPEKEALAAQAP
jgi:hypothetical protein